MFVCIVISDGITEIASEVKQTPNLILNSLGLAFHQVSQTFEQILTVHADSLSKSLAFSSFTCILHHHLLVRDNMYCLCYVQFAF